MRAMRLKQPGGLDNLYLDTLTTREPDRGEIKVRIHACSLNFHDLAIVSGKIAAVDDVIPLSDGAGIVEAVGGGVTEFEPGDSVVSTFFPCWSGGVAAFAKCQGVPGERENGFACDSVTAPACAFTPCPAGFTHAEAATLTCAGVTAWRALVEQGRAKPGDAVLVLGSGGVSMFALQFAKALGCQVIATTASKEKQERLLALGADHVINYCEHAEWGDEVARYCDGGVDHVIEIGGGGTLNQSIRACRMGGHIALIGILAGITGEVSTATIMGKQIRLQGMMVGSHEHQLDMIKAVEINHIKPVIDKVFKLEDLADAFRYQESRQHIGKICIEC